MPSMKEYSSLTETQAVSNSRTSDKQKIEVKTNDNDDEGVLYFIYNNEGLEDDNMEYSNWLQCNNCNLWVHLHCIQYISEQEVTEKMLKLKC